MDSSLTSTLHQPITTIDSNDTTDDIGRNLIHQTDDAISIGENSKVAQHDPDFENAYLGDDEEHLEAPRFPILSLKVANNHARISPSENVLEGHTRSQPRSSFASFDSNCPKQQRMFNCCDQVDLQTLKLGQELYTYTSGINLNQILLIGQLMWIVTPEKG